MKGSRLGRIYDRSVYCEIVWCVESLDPNTLDSGNRCWSEHFTVWTRGNVSSTQRKLDVEAPQTLVDIEFLDKYFGQFRVAKCVVVGFRHKMKSPFLVDSF